MINFFLFLSLSIFGLLVGCLPEDKKKDDSVKNDSGEVVSASELKLNGFWTGEFDQAGKLRALIYNGNLYALDEDKSFSGTIKNPQDDDLVISLKSYSFTDEDTNNNEYTSEGSATSYEVEGLLATTNSIVGTYQTSGGDFGNLTLAKEDSWENNSSLSALVGKWTTTDLEMNITSKGQFLGFSKADGNNCSYSGKIELIDAAKILMKSTITRKNCSSANGEFEGYMAVTDDKELELYASNTAGNLLFMRFSAPAAEATDGSSGGSASGGDSSGATSSGASSTGGSTSSGA